MDCGKLIKANALKNVKYSRIDTYGNAKLNFTKCEIIDGIVIKKILEEAGNLLVFHRKKFKKLIIFFNKIEFADKLTYITLECILYDLFVSYNVTTEIIGKKIDYGLQTKGVLDSLLLEIISGKIDYDEFIRKFSMVYTECHFRRVVPGNIPDDSVEICKLMSDLKTFLKFFGIDALYRSTISEMISELADNAREHTKSDCLIDLDVATYYPNKEKSYCALNIAIINFSNKCLGYSLKEKILYVKYSKADRYEKVKEAYNIHSKSFGEKYGIEDFFNIASFQDSITGRFYDTSSGGTGLTSLIKSLEENSDSHYGYVLSGNKGINFILDYLKFNKDKWIGFNEDNDFISQIPSVDVILTSPTYIPGTAYNFTLVVEIGG